MAQTKNALIRYKTIDKCLQNRYKLWTLADLINACSDVLYDYEGKDVNVSMRTIQLDLQLMRSDKLGYNAPIEVYNKKFYRYADDNYSITNIPITDNDMQVLFESVEILKQFKDFSLFNELGGIIQRLEDIVYTEKNQQAPVIHLEKNENLRGLKYLDLIYQAIIKKIVLLISYQSFKVDSASDFLFHPFLLKEYNNRWFVLGKKDGHSNVLTLALDRIEKIEIDLATEHLNENFDANEYYKNTVGVTVLNENQLAFVHLRFNASNTPYIITKPLHHSQKIIEVFNDGSATFEVKVHLNYEFERLVLGFGESVKVLKPRNFKSRIKKNLQQAINQYVPRGGEVGV
jgi:predicted DNA-binding transcriptional regulator YafY